MENLKGFKPIPGYTNYLVNIDGVIISNLTKRVLKPSINSRGYLTVTLTDDDGKRRGMGLHRAIALAFIPCEGDTNKLIVNHIDGNKRNNDPANFEWTTYKTNSEHAGALGLTTKCVPISIKDIEGNVKEFPSFLECAKYLNISKDAVAWRAKKYQSRLCSKGYQYAIGNNVTEWPDLDEMAAVHYLDSGVLKLYSSKQALAMDLQIRPSTVTLRLKEPPSKIYPGNVKVGYLASFKKQWSA